MKATKEKEADLGNGSIGKLLFRLALPAILAQIINVMYNMVDRMYIGHIPEVGPSALTGVGVTMPVIMAISAFAALVSMGGAPRASIMMGKGDNETEMCIRDRIQAAGRCNRNGGPEKGLVCLIKMSEEAERISSLKDIRTAQEAMLCTLQAYRKSCLLYTSRCV